MRTRLLPLATCAALALASCSGRPDELEPLTLDSGGAIADAYVASEYGELSIVMTARGGATPYQWALADRPAGLTWLAVDQSGRLTGVPPGPTGPLSFTATVTDARGSTDSKTLTVTVKVCRDGQRKVCTASSADACVQNTVLCSAGTYPGCAVEGGTPSTDAAQCGPGAAPGGACGACDPAAADRCDGTCFCGASPSCSGATPDCCVGTCTDLDADPRNCGTCGTDCTAAPLPANATATCAAGTCAFECNPGYTRCGDACVNLQTDGANCGGCGTVCGGDSAFCREGSCFASCATGSGLTPCAGGACVDLSSDEANCGACGAPCVPPAGGTVSCVSSACQASCGGLTLCGSACISTASDPSNCGSCGRVCPLSMGNSHATCSSGFCGEVCNSGYRYCDFYGDCIRSTVLCPVDPCGGTLSLGYGPLAPVCP